MSSYNNVKGVEGIGSDIKWCGRWVGGKYCLYCRHKAPFKVWSQKWHWYYLLSWSEKEYYWWWWQQAHYTTGGWNTTRSAVMYKDSPRRYSTIGLRPNNIKSLLRKGCRNKRKCRCMSIAQRGAWYCPSCFEMINLYSKHKGLTFHEATIMNRDELKREILMLLLSGVMRG